MPRFKSPSGTHPYSLEILWQLASKAAWALWEQYRGSRQAHWRKLALWGRVRAVIVYDRIVNEEVVL